MVVLNYKPLPTAEKFHADNSFIRFVMGPTGSGKTLMCLADILLKTISTNHATRGVIIVEDELAIRNIITYIANLVDEDLLNYWGKLNTLCVGKYIEIIFIAAKNRDVLYQIQNLELSWVIIEKLYNHPSEIISVSASRVGRFNRRDNQWYGVVGNFGCEHRVNVDFTNVLPSNAVLYRQPPAIISTQKKDYYDTINLVVNPLAENLQNLPKNYYKHILESGFRTTNLMYDKNN